MDNPGRHPVRYLLDTNVLSDARRGTSASLDQWLANQWLDDLTLSAITVFELEHGVRRIERRDEHQGSLLRRWLDGVVRESFAGKVLPVDDGVATVAADLHVPDPMQLPDSFIAATALVHGLTLVTRNTTDFERTGVTLLNPWTQ